MTGQIFGTQWNDRITLGSGSQTVDGGAGWDRIVSLGDAGEPDPAQTQGDEGRINDPVPADQTVDVLTGGRGGDRFEFRALLNATDEVIAEHTSESGRVNWRAVAGENDNVHDHWVEGFGLDIITDFNKDERDSIAIVGHTVQIASITYGEDENGTYSLITVISQQGDGGAGGANTANGAHDEDPLGQIKVYGDQVTEDDITVNAGVFYGVDQLEHADTAFGDPNEWGNTQHVVSNTGGTFYQGLLYRQSDVVELGMGSQNVNAGGGNDTIYAYSDGGEPDPAQTDGSTGRINDPIPAGTADDTLAGGQGRDTFAFRLLLNATDEVLAEHTRADGSVNWRRVAGENDNVHDHWVEGIGDDVILDFSKQDGDKIDIRGHTVEIAEITYGVDDQGNDYSLIQLRSQQGDGGGAHDEDLLGTIRVYGDRVEEDDILVRANVFYGIDQIEDLADTETDGLRDRASAPAEQPVWGRDDPETIEETFTGSGSFDRIHAGSGSQTVDGGGRGDHFISYGDGGEPVPAQTGDAADRINDGLGDDASDDVFTGGGGRDRFEFRALLNATAEVIAQHTNADGSINWRGVAGENDNVHDHWVEGIGNDVIMDYSQDDRDLIIIRGHTVEVAGITYGSDDTGDYSLIQLRSQQGDGGGAHDEDLLGTIRVYGDRVEIDDLIVRANVFDGMDQLQQADLLADYNGGTQQFRSDIDGETITTAPDTIETTDRVVLGLGAQTVDTGAGRDHIRVLSDGGEPDPAQTDGAEGRIYDPVPGAQSVDIVSGGQGRDWFEFNFLINATDAVLAEHMRGDGSVNWRQVAGENDLVHDHWVESGGDDILLDFSRQDGDQIVLRGHTVELAEITYGEDDRGDFSVLHVRSQQGDGGGAHDEDSLGTITVYGDQVTEDDVIVRARNVFDGIDQLAEIDLPSAVEGDRGADTLVGTTGTDILQGEGGNDLINGRAGDDFIFGGWGHDTLSGGRGDDWIDGGNGNDVLLGRRGDDMLVTGGRTSVMTGGSGEDTFAFEDDAEGATITDWESGVDSIDLTRIDAITGIDDLEIYQFIDTFAQVRGTNDDGDTLLLTILSDDAFTLVESDFQF